MPKSFMWSLLIVLVVFPLILLVTEYASHQSARADTSTATRQAIQNYMKKNIAKGSLRDTDIYPTQPTLKLESDDDLVEAYENSVTTNQRGTLINFAEKDVNKAYSPNPPMLAIRSNVVRDSFAYGFLSNFNEKINEQFVIQNEKIAILEICATSPSDDRDCDFSYRN